MHRRATETLTCLPYETDILDFAFDHIVRPANMRSPDWRSLLYALLEGAAGQLELGSDDSGVTLYVRPGGRTNIVLFDFDAVPGGAGSPLHIAAALDKLIEAALHGVANCEYGEETSCYGCLRSYRNQSRHENIVSGYALETCDAEGAGKRSLSSYG